MTYGVIHDFLNMYLVAATRIGREVLGHMVSFMTS